MSIESSIKTPSELIIALRQLALLGSMTTPVPTAVPIGYSIVVRVQIPEAKLWHFLDIAPRWLRRIHQANPRKDERVIYFHCNPETEDQKHLEKAVASLA